MAKTFISLGGWAFALRNVAALGPVQGAATRPYYEVHLVGGRILQVGDNPATSTQVERDRAAFLAALDLYGEQHA